MLDAASVTMGSNQSSDTFNRACQIDTSCPRAAVGPRADIGKAKNAAVQPTQTGQTPHRDGRAFDILPLTSLILAAAFAR